MDISNHNRHRNHHHTTVTASKPTRKILSIFLKFIVMSFILPLFLLFIGLAAIILLHLLLAGSFLHRRRRLHTRSSTPRASSLSLHDIQTHIPQFKFSATTAASDDCSICLEYLNEGEICRVLPVCDHVFHARCVDRWLTKVPSCPVCRTRIRLDNGGSSDSIVCDDETKFLWAMGVGR